MKHVRFIAMVICLALLAGCAGTSLTEESTQAPTSLVTTPTTATDSTSAPTDTPAATPTNEPTPTSIATIVKTEEEIRESNAEYLLDRATVDVTVTNSTYSLPDGTLLAPTDDPLVFNAPNGCKYILLEEPPKTETVPACLSHLPAVLENYIETGNLGLDFYYEMKYARYAQSEKQVMEFLEERGFTDAKFIGCETLPGEFGYHHDLTGTDDIRKTYIARYTLKSEDPNLNGGTYDITIRNGQPRVEMFYYNNATKQTCILYITEKTAFTEYFDRSYQEDCYFEVTQQENPQYGFFATVDRIDAETMNSLTVDLLNKWTTPMEDKTNEE